MGFTPSPTSGIGVAARVVTTGNINPPSNVPGKNGIILSLSGTAGTSGYPSTFQLTPEIEDVKGNPVSAGTVFTVTSVAAASPAPYTLTAAALAVAGQTTYTGTITGGAANAYEGRLFAIAGFDLAANNGIFECVASTATTLVLLNAAGVADTHAATAQDQTAVAVYTGTFTGGGSNAFADLDFVVAGFVTNPSNNGTFFATASSATTVTLANPGAIAETHAATATAEELTALTYVEYGASTNSGGTTHPVNGGKVAILTVSAAGLLTAVAEGESYVEASFPSFNQSGTTIVSAGNIMNGLPNNKVYSLINVKVVL